MQKEPTRIVKSLVKTSINHVAYQALFIYLSACKKYLKKYHIRPLSNAEPCREIQYILPAYVCVLYTITEDDIFGIEVISAIKADTKSQQLHCFGVGS